ncbi:hypothetical protein MWU59_06535 [Flavobacteriaceae bacterium F08102]|nr:hypothetical protein [Flavobacteriaceae bacterium F08102]
MKKFLVIACFSLLLACGSVQKTSNQLASGNYKAAFNTAVASLNKDKTKKANQKNIPLLKEAYDKAALQDLAEIKKLQQTVNANNLKKIYGNYLNLDLRQDEIKLLQPLFFEDQEVHFEFDDYSDEINAAKARYAAYLYNEAQRKLKGNMEDARVAYAYLEDLIYVDPTYKPNLNELLQRAKKRGSVFVYISLKNNTRIAKDSLTIFTQINTNNFSNPWVIFHHQKDRSITYSKEISIALNKMTMETPLIQPETIRQEARIQDGWTYQKDSDGNVMKDEKGNNLKTPVYKTVLAEVVLYQQVRNAKLEGQITVLSAGKPQVTKPISGEAKFQNTYAKYRGDKRAIEEKYYEAIQRKEMEFPPEYAFVNFAMSNFKKNVEQFLSQQEF